MRILIAFTMLMAAAHASAYDHFISPDGRFEAYTTENLPDGGMKLFLRSSQKRDAGQLLWQNGRWIDAKWSPDSHFLAVIDHPDGHVADVYVFGITSTSSTAVTIATLLYHTPAPWTYDVKWDLIGWGPKKREIILSQEVRDQNAGTHATHKLTAIIGSKPLPYDQAK